MQTIVSDDGSTITIDANGNVVAVTDSTGAAVAPAGSIEYEFRRVLTSGFSALLNQAFAPRPVTVQAVQQPAAINSRLVGFGLLAAAAFAVYQLAK